jgi:hypothetical protein
MVAQSAAESAGAALLASHAISFEASSVLLNFVSY